MPVGHTEGSISREAIHQLVRGWSIFSTIATLFAPEGHKPAWSLLRYVNCRAVQDAPRRCLSGSQLCTMVGRAPAILALLAGVGPQKGRISGHQDLVPGNAALGCFGRPVAHSRERYTSIRSGIVSRHANFVAERASPTGSGEDASAGLPGCGRLLSSWCGARTRSITPGTRMSSRPAHMCCMLSDSSWLHQISYCD